MIAPMYTKNNYVGYAEFSLNSDNEPEMIAFHPASRKPLRNFKNVLRSCFHDNEISESEYAEGYKIKPINWRWTWLTVYISQDQSYFTLYEAIPDTRKGIDITP